MRSVLAALCAIFCLGAPANAARNTYDGSIVILSVPAACPLFKTGEVFHAIFYPTPDTSRFVDSLFVAGQDRAFVITPKLPAKEFKGSGTGTGVGIRRGTWIPFDFAFKSLVRTPANLTPTTPSVSITGKVEDFGFIATCDATFRAAGTLVVIP
jgi:hypothetical protein